MAGESSDAGTRLDALLSAINGSHIFRQDFVQTHKILTKIVFSEVSNAIHRRPGEDDGEYAADCRQASSSFASTAAGVPAA